MEGPGSSRIGQPSRKRSHAGGGLYLRPRDMAKLGAMILDQGRWQGRTVIQPDLINLLTSRVTLGVRNWAGHSFDYGYGW